MLIKEFLISKIRIILNRCPMWSKMRGIWAKNYCDKIRKSAIKKGNIELDDNNIIYMDSLGLSWFLPYYKSDLIQATILVKGDYYEREYLDFICKKWEKGKIGNIIQGKAILDIGSNIGNHSLYLLKECGASFAYIFEPVSDTFRIMKKNMEINNFGSNVELINAGVGERKARAVIETYSKMNTGGATLKECLDGETEILSIDELNIDKDIAFVKIDTEGFEVGVIRGMLKTVEKYHPYIMIEIQKSNFEVINGYLAELGYSYMAYDSENYFFYTEV